MTLKLCTLYNGVPYGPAIIQYTDKNSKYLSFEGVGFFTEGKLHNGPFICVDADGWGRSISSLKDGRPYEGSFGSYFYPQGFTEHVNSLTEKSYVSGWQCYSGLFSINALSHGESKMWWNNTRTFIG